MTTPATTTATAAATTTTIAATVATTADTTITATTATTLSGSPRDTSTAKGGQSASDAPEAGPRFDAVNRTSTSATKANATTTATDSRRPSGKAGNESSTSGLVDTNATARVGPPAPHAPPNHGADAEPGSGGGGDDHSNTGAVVAVLVVLALLGCGVLGAVSFAKQRSAAREAAPAHGERRGQRPARNTRAVQNPTFDAAAAQPAASGGDADYNYHDSVLPDADVDYHETIAPAGADYMAAVTSNPNYAEGGGDVYADVNVQLGTGPLGGALEAVC